MYVMWTISKTTGIDYGRGIRKGGTVDLSGHGITRDGSFAGLKQGKQGDRFLVFAISRFRRLTRYGEPYRCSGENSLSLVVSRGGLLIFRLFLGMWKRTALLLHFR